MYVSLSHAPFKKYFVVCYIPCILQLADGYNICNDRWRRVSLDWSLSLPSSRVPIIMSSESPGTHPVRKGEGSGMGLKNINDDELL